MSMFRSFGVAKKAKPSKSTAVSSVSLNSGSGADGSGATGGGRGASGAGKDTSSAGGAGYGGDATSGKFDHVTLDDSAVISLKDVSPADQPKLFARHLKICQECFSFNDGSYGVGGYRTGPGGELIGSGNTIPFGEKPTEAAIHKQKMRASRKRDLLLGLVEYINKDSIKIRESDFADIIAMVSANIFRSLPPRPDPLADADEDEPVLENSWPHLQIVYEFLLRFIVSNAVDPKTAKKHVSHAFILQLLGLFDSEDPRERDYLKTILHRIYGRFMALRAFIRKSITNVFLSSTYLEDHNNGIAELLEILGSIINGFALPLKAEHKRFLDKGLIPLHKVKNIGAFHQQLEYCITQYVEKDNEMAEPVILGLLKFWPEMNSPKQLQFLHELEEVLELTRSPEFRNVIEPLFKRLALCIDSQHFQVAERTLLLWNNEYLFTLMKQNRREVLPLVFKVLKANSDSHWNFTVQNLSQNVLKSFEDLDADLYQDTRIAATQELKQEESDEQDRTVEWEKIISQATGLAQVAEPPGPPK